MSKIEENKLTLETCLDLYGAHIRLCVKDYVLTHDRLASIRRKLCMADDENVRARLRTILDNYDSARIFLFEGGLDDAIEKFHLPIEADAIRRYVLDRVNKQPNKGERNEFRADVGENSSSA